MGGEGGRWEVREAGGRLGRQVGGERRRWEVKEEGGR